uniref:N-acetylneuraminate lyase n=2 Tax=Photinus pyralis TaxID=7054 RepID=A0A1Y1KH54_PHOPY
MGHRKTATMLTYRGLMAPVFTPFKNDVHKTLNVDVIPSYADYCQKNGIKGILVNGTTGEGSSMTTKERKLVTEVWMEQCKSRKQHLMVQVGGTSLPDVLSLAAHAEKTGADSILCLPELFQKPTSIADLIRYLKMVAKAAPNTPLLYYHIPRMTHVNIHMGTFLNSVGNSIPTFSGIKFSSTVLDEGLAAVKADKEKYCVFLGAHAIMAGAYTLGFSLGIATTQNIFPQFGETILKSIMKGQLLQAQETQADLNTAVNIINKYGPFVPSMKAAMQILSSVPVGETREPVTPVPVEQMKKMEIELRALPFIK